MGSVFHLLCPRYNGPLTPTDPTAFRIWETFTFYYLTARVQSSAAHMSIGRVLVMEGQVDFH